MKSGRTSRLAWMASYVALAALVQAACTWAPPAPDVPPSQRDGVLIHSWALTTQPASAPWIGQRTRLYTYVLSGDAARDLGGASPARLQARKSLGGLLNEVQATQVAASIDEAALLRGANQFVLPARRGAAEPGSVDRPGAQRFSIDQYDFELAAGYLNRFRLVLDGPEFAPRLARLGPFLIATQKPVGEIVTQSADGSISIDRTAPVLLIDLTGSRPEAAPIYVEGFKQAVRFVLPQQSTSFQPLRAQFASVLIRFGEALPFVAEALASTRRLIDPAPAARGALQ